ELPEKELLSHLSVLRDSELVYERGIYPQSTYIFKHALTQEVAYNSLLLKKGKEIHEKIGIAIEEFYSERLEEFYEMLAYHYSRSDDLEKAYRYLKLSGHKATRNYSNWEAFYFYKEAINILNQLSETEQNKREQIETHLLITIPMHLLGYPGDSLQILQEGERQLKEIGDEKSLSIFYGKLGSYYAIRGEPLLAIKYTESPYQKAEKAQDIDLMAPIACDLFSSYHLIGKFFKIADVAPKVLAILKKTHREKDFFGARYNVYSGLCAHYVYSFGMLGSFDQGRAVYESGLHFALDVNSLYGLGFIELSYGVLMINMGDGEKGIEHIQKSLRYIEEAKAIYMLGPAWAWLGHGYYLKGELETAQKSIEKGIKIHNGTGLSRWLPTMFCQLGMVHIDSGDLKSAQGCIDKALRISQKNNEKHWEGFSRIWQGKLSGRVGPSQTCSAEKYLLEGINICDELKLKPYSAQGYLYLGELYADRGQKDIALENLKKADGMFQEMGMDYWQARAQEVLGRL
ncbi:MAG: guanylate cyclase, partial [Deltaproteobacteria bacterium]|nr:guanylate cyclase [Deltaproteobacteria bacterium]